MKLKLLCLSIFLIFVSGLNAQWLHEQEITLPIEPGEENDLFPRAIKTVSIDKNRALIGAFRSETVYLYKRDATDNWLQESKLEASDGTNFDFFGHAVSISSDKILVGAMTSDAKGLNSGAAYIYEQNENGEWLEKAKLTASDGREAHFFGASGAISGDIAVVSAIQGSRSGDVYVYERNINGDWIEQDKLQPSGRRGSDELGSSVSMNGNSIIIGAPGDNGKGDESGTAYIFTQDENGEWFQEAKLTPEDIDSEYQFGRSVSISGDKAVVASFGVERTDVAYVYTRDSNGVWQQEDKLIPSDVLTNNFFNNSSVCISGDRIVMAASIDNGPSGSLSSAFVYIRDNNGLWSEESKLTETDGYAHSVSLYGDEAIVASKFGGMVSFFTSTTAAIQLEPEDILILITSPSCPGSENGSITITNNSEYDLVATLSGLNYDGRNIDLPKKSTIAFSELPSAEYSIGFTGVSTNINAPSFTANVPELEMLSVSGKDVDVLSQLGRINVKGSKVYEVKTDSDILTFDFSNSNTNIIELPLKKGVNNFEIKGVADCQGVERISFLFNDLKLYPNPISDWLYVSGFNKDGNIKISISDLSGKVVKKLKRPVANGVLKINVSDITNSGVYILSIYQDEKDRVEFKVVIE